MLYLIPVSLGSEDPCTVLPPSTVEIARRLDAFIAENPKSARQFLKAIGHPRPMREIEIHVLDEHSSPRDIESLCALLDAGREWGLLSEAGCPAVADPGSELIQRAHAAGVRVVPLVGPSSILLALMASGLNGQRFTFHGYLPAVEAARNDAIRRIEARAEEETQIFIETPYRNGAMLRSLLSHCRRDTLLCIAVDLTLPTESVRTRRIEEWRRAAPDLDRRPAVFLVGRPAA